MDQDHLVHAAAREIVAYTKDRRACLIFASGVKHGKHVAETIEKHHSMECGFVDGTTPTLYRDQMLDRFRKGDLKYLCNVNVLTTGFDAPNVDCVALLRPTMSPGLFYQMCGRGFRLHPGKADCLVLDFGGNVMRHGPVDQIRIGDCSTKGTGEAPVKECPQCRALIAAGYATCPDCGHVFPPPERRKHEAEAAATGILTGQVTIAEHEVRRVHYSVHVKRDAPPEAPRSMRVEYEIGFYEYQSEWICFEHPRNSYPRTKAEEWWRFRSHAPVPDTAEQAVELAEAGALAETQANQHWRRPGKTQGWSATLKGRVLYVFSSNAAPFEPARAYGPFAVYTLLEHRGDYTRAASALRAQGYGTSPASAIPATNLGTGPPAAPVIQLQPLTVRALVSSFPELRRPIVHGLLREGETMNVIASPKAGKSWLVTDLALSIATGRDWLGYFRCERGDVLILDNELHSETSAHRIPKVAASRKVPVDAYADRVWVQNLRGQLQDVFSLSGYFQSLDPGRFKVIILDAFYRFMPRDMDENDNGTMASLYNHIDRYADRLTQLIDDRGAVTAYTYDSLDRQVPMIVGVPLGSL